MMSCIYRYQGPEDGDNDVPEYLALTKVMMMMTMTFCTGIGGQRMVMMILEPGQEEVNSQLPNQTIIPRTEKYGTAMCQIDDDEEVDAMMFCIGIGGQRMVMMKKLMG